MRDTKVLLVCLGNIIRSTMGEALLRKYADQHRLNWHIRSAGTNRWHKGGPADPRTIVTCEKHNIDVSSHIARRLQIEDFDNYDIIYSMHEDVVREMRAISSKPEHLKKVVNFMDALYPGENRNVFDPWYSGDEEAFEKCFRIIDEGCRKIVSDALESVRRSS